MTELFLDIETTGLPNKGTNWEKDFMGFPHIVEIAWKYKGVMKQFLIYQEGREIPIEASYIHGITTDQGNDTENTITIKDAMVMFISDCSEADKIVGHNIYFDTSIIKATVLREFGVDSFEAKKIIEGLDKTKRIDTMYKTMKLMKGMSSLIDLHGHLFGIGFSNHSAESDVLAVERCYIELKKRGVLIIK